MRLLRSALHWHQHMQPAYRHTRGFLSASGTSSHVKKGTAYEHECIAVMSNHAMALVRVGGSGDRGVDVRGSLVLPSSEPAHKLSHTTDGTPASLQNTHSVPSTPANVSHISVVGQCKCVKQPCGPEMLQAFESVVLREQSRAPTVGIFFSPLGYGNDTL